MNPVEITAQSPECALNRSMPLSGLEQVTAGFQYSYFYAFDSSDVWTADGWLITAVQNDGVTHHVRKGDQVGRQVIEPSEVLYYKPNAKTKYYLEIINAAITQD